MNNTSGKLEKHGATIRTYVIVWAVMVALTIGAAASATTFKGSLWDKTPILIVIIKTFLIAAFFMNLKYEKGFIRIMIFFIPGVILILSLFLYSDVGYR
ncbi:MAG: cytochrome C oxidase subunit IV family protein [Nitrospirae bacterium]|nr:cytochrome C oxidase subunit IV family protein [Nitrospirota bacterium]